MIRSKVISFAVCVGPFELFLFPRLFVRRLCSERPSRSNPRTTPSAVGKTGQWPKTGLSNYGGRADVNTVDDGVNDTTHLPPGLQSRFELNLLDFALSFDCVSDRASGIAVALAIFMPRS